MEKRIELERRARKANQITDLNLDNCRSTSIVGLTDEYTALESLSLINVGLTTLKGFPKLPNLKKLELSDNRISNGLNYLHTSPKLLYLNLSGNKIKDLEALKPLEEFKQLAVLDLFNNEATQVENYRAKIFEMLPSLQYLDGFDSNDVEAPSEGDDCGSEDNENVFSLNGIEIDLDELEAFEKRLKAKREAKLLQEQNTTTSIDTIASNLPNVASSSSSYDKNTAAEAEVDELDEYLKTLKLREQQQDKVVDDDKAKMATTNSNNTSAPMNFALLLYWFLAILNMACATFKEEEYDEEPSSSNESDEVVSLSEVYNEELEEDDENELWDADTASGDSSEQLTDSDEEEANGSSAVATVESQARGKKRKHEG